MKRCSMQRLTLCVLVLAALPAVAGDFFVEGTCSYAGVDTRGLYLYEMTLSWNVDKHGLSHLTVLLDDGSNCTLGSLVSGIDFPDPTGEGVGEPAACKVVFKGSIETHDPSVGLEALVMKFEPLENDYCEPGPTGTATFRILSPYPPAPIAEDNLFAIEKSGIDFSRGELTGVFPGLPCNPVAAESMSWSQIKAIYR